MFKSVNYSAKVARFRVGVGVVILLVTSCSQMSKPDLPVRILQRESLVKEGLVAQFHNESGRRLVVDVVLEDKGNQNRKAGALVLEANGMAELGWAEGWKFDKGDKITISHKDYRISTCHIE